VRVHRDVPRARARTARRRGTRRVHAGPSRRSLAARPAVEPPVLYELPAPRLV
jgi:hypothetical protein